MNPFGVLDFPTGMETTAHDMASLLILVLHLRLLKSWSFLLIHHHVHTDD